MEFKVKPIALKFALSFFIISINVIAQTSPQYAKFNINNISTYIFNDGMGDIHPSGDSGFEFPKGSQKTIIYQTGFVWGAKIDGQIKVGGSSQKSGLTPGRILPNGNPADPNSPNVRVFRVRRDYKEADLSSEALNEGKSTSEIFSQYQKDWNEWPAKDGAPFEDVNRNGIYEPFMDVPGQSGADQTLWFVANDLDSNKTKSLYGSLPMGVEMQVTVWGFNQDNLLGDALLKQYVIINKSKKQFEDVYFSVFSDIDLGSDASDDLLGCDSLLNLTYAYNGDDRDPSYGSNIPVIGFSLLQGPLVKGTASDVATYKGKRIVGFKNLPMTSLGLGSNTSVKIGDAKLGDYVKGTLAVYNVLQGKYKDGSSIQDPVSGAYTKFPFSGEPLNGTGFICGKAYPSGIPFVKGDYRMFLNSGPFNMAAGDTQEVSFVQLAANALIEGNNTFASLSLLKKNTFYIQNSMNGIPTQIVNLTAPSVSVSSFDKKVLLDWGEDINQINKIENGDFTYKFEGYNIYQFPKANSKLSEGKLIATYDLYNGLTQIKSSYFDPKTNTFPQTIIINGSDSGIKRNLLVTNDIIRNDSLANWNEYFFGVTQYSYQSLYSFLVNYRESDVKIYKAIPQPLSKGMSLQHKIGDNITVSHTSGKSQAWVTAKVVDPSKFYDREYEITFRKVNDLITFSVKDINSGTIKIQEISLSGTRDDNPLVDGVLITIRDLDKKFPLTESDVYRYQTKGILADQNLELENLDKINVFPNPIYGTVRSELFNNDRFVTFTYLPQRANIRIFNLAGQLVRKLSKDSNEAFFRWNMLNDNNFQIPTGLYIVHIELPDYGKVKILKLALLNDVFTHDRLIP